MRILFDECVPRRVKTDAPRTRARPDCARCGIGRAHERRAPAEAAGQFDVFITIDKSIEYQQNLSVHPLAFVLLRGRSNDIADLAPLVE